MAETLSAGEALIALRADASQLSKDMQSATATVVAQLQKIEENTKSVGLAALAKQVEEFARATAAAQKDVAALKFAAIADEVNSLTSAFKGAEDGVQITEDLARAEQLLGERFAMVRAEIERQAEAHRGLIDEETLLERTTLQLEAAQRQHDAALATVRGRALQAAEGIAALEAEEQASALAAQKAWEATAQLAIEQDRATKEAAELAEAEARTAQGLANLGTAITHAAEETEKANARWAALKPSLTGVADAAQAAGLAFGAFAGGVGVVAGAAANLTMEAARIGESFNDLAIKTSTTVEALSRYDLAAKTADVSQESLAGGMRKLAQAAVEAGDEGSASALAFNALGVEVRDANGNIKPMGQLLQETTRALADAGDGAETMASAQQLLGRSALDFLPLAKMTKEELDDLAKASEELGLVWSTKDAAAADKLSDSVTVLDAGVKGLGLSIGRDLIPVAQQVVDDSLSWLRANSELMRSGFKDWVVGVKQIIEGLAPLVRDTADAFLWWGGGLDDTFGGLNQQIRDTEEKMKSLKRTMDTPLMASGEVDKATEEYKHLALQLEGLKVRAEQAQNAQAPLATAVDGTTTALRDQKVIAKETGEQFDAMIINWEDANKAAEEAKQKQKEAAAEAKRLAEANEQLQKSIDALKLDAIAADLDDATEAMERSKTVVADENYLRALEDIEAAYEAQVEAAKDAAEAAVEAGADKSKAAEMEALAVDKAQREMADAVAQLDAVLVENTGTWDDLGQEITDLPDEVRAFIPTLDGIAAATGNVDEATFGLTETTKEAKSEFELAGKVTDDFAKSLVDLAVSGGNAEDVLKSLGSSVLNDLTSTLTDGLGSMLKTGLADIGNEVAGGLADALSPGVTEAAEQVGASGAEALVGTVTDGIASFMPEALVGALGSGGVAAAVVAGVAGIGVGIAAAFGAFESPDIQQQIARMLSKQIKKSFGDPEVFSAIDAGLETVGLYLGEGLGTEMVKAPKRLGLEVGEAYAALGKDLSYQFSDGFYQDMKEHGTQLIHSSIADVLHVFYTDITQDVVVGIQQSALAAGTAIAAEMGLVGDKAIKFAQQWSIAFIGMMHEAGKGADEILTALHRIDSSLGTSQELIAAFHRLQASMIEAGVDMDALYAKINEQLKMITGKKVKVGNLDEVLAAVGGDATRALGVIENAMDLAGISIERFSGQLSDVVLAISNDAGTAIREAGEDFKDFGNEADGTADILRQKVLTAIDDVIKTAEELGYSTESIDAFKTAVSLIPPEMLKSSEFVNALRDDFAAMAVASHMSVQELIDSIDPPLPNAMRNAILSAHDLGVAIGALAGAPLSSLKEVTDRMKQFADDMYRYSEESGEQVKELTAFGQQLVNDTVSAINGMWDTIAKDGQASQDEIYAVFEQIAQIPAETLGDPAIQSAIASLLAKIGEQTGDAYIIALSALPEVTKEQLDEALALYEQWKQDVEANPPVVEPEVAPPPDAPPPDAPAPDVTGPDTTPASTTPPPAPIPAETLQSWTDITTAAKEYAAAVVQGTDAVAALSQGTVTAAAAMLEAIRPIYGAADDEASLSAIHEKLRLITEDLLGWSGNWADDFDFVRGAVINLTLEVGAYATALAEIPSEITTTITTKYETQGSPPSGSPPAPTPTPAPAPGMATGGWIPGAPSDPYPITAHGGELVVPAATAATLPPDVVSRLLSGNTFSLPSSIVDRLSSPATPPTISSSSVPGAASSSPASPAPGWTMVPVREQDIQDGALVRLERAMRDGYAWMNEQGRLEVHTAIRARARGGR